MLILVPPDTDLEEVLALVNPANLEGLLRRRLESTGFFGARFREGAGRALLLPRPGFDKRTPLWQTRLRSKRLFAAVSVFPDFPIILEAWRQCLRDEFDLEALKDRLSEWSAGRIVTHTCRTKEPSPFTEGILWRQINEKMYAGDEPTARNRDPVDPSLWDQLLGTDLPGLPVRLVEDWEVRWGRTYPGYAPESPADLADFLEVRVALSQGEWEALLQACSRDSGRTTEEWAGSVPTESRHGLVGVPAIAALWGNPQPLWVRWLEGRGPISLEAMADLWGQTPESVAAWAQQEAAKGTLVVGPLTEGATGPEICLARTWDQLVRRLRLERRSSVPVRAPQVLPLFLARWQGLVHPDRNPGDLESRVGPLLGLSVDAGLWESALLPSRITPYYPADFDRLFIEGGLRWFGSGPEKITLGFPEDERWLRNTHADEADVEACTTLFGSPSPPREVPFPDLAKTSGLSTAALTETLWNLAWKGLVSATTFGPLRSGLKAGFRFDLGTEPGRAPVRGLQRWTAARSTAGLWRQWGQTPEPGPTAAMDQLEDSKRRARTVLDRYGVVFRSLLSQESPAFQWKSVFPALRLMELSGEILGGRFFDGIPGLQFALPEALRDLEAGGDETACWIQHAQDPTSLCGSGLEAFPELPRRVTGTWLWWRGQTLVGVLTAGGKKLARGTDLPDQDLESLVRRTATILLSGGQTRWTLENIDGQPAADHPLSAAFQATGFRPHGEKLILWKN